MSKEWRIGCSGFAYKEWKEVFYPVGLPQRKWFEFYTQQYNTLELNTTFYRFPTIKSLDNWYVQAPEGFDFSAKMPRSITHFKKFEDTQRMVEDFYGLLREGLKEKLGCVLTQLPPQLVYSPLKLETILAQMDPGFTNVIEFRHNSWWRPDVWKRLNERNVTFAGVSFPKVEFDEAVINKSLVYYRFHGVPHLFYSQYDEAFLEKTISFIEAHPLAQKVYLYFNNTASTAALRNSQFAQQYVRKGSHQITF